MEEFMNDRNKLQVMIQEIYTVNVATLTEAYNKEIEKILSKYPEGSKERESLIQAMEETKTFTLNLMEARKKRDYS